MAQIRINKVEGKSDKKGLKQNKLYTITRFSTPPTHPNFHTGTDDRGREFSIWNFNGDWSKIAIAKRGGCRYSYTTDFELIDFPDEKLIGLLNK